MAYTSTRTAARYSTDPEVETIELLLNRLGATDLADKALFFSEMAGIARFELDEKINQGGHTYSINAHYQDADDLIEDSLQVRSEGRRTTGYLADLIERISTDIKGFSPGEWISEVNRWAKKTGIQLAPKECFGLGLATFFLAGPPDYRRRWRQGESVPPIRLMADRGLTKEVFASIKTAWDEIRPPLAPEGQMPQSIK